MNWIRYAKFFPFHFLFLLFGINHVDTESISLKHQLENNVPLDEIECKNKSHILTERPNEKLACVYESTSEKLHWNMVEFRIIELLSYYSDDLFPVSYKITGAEINSIEMQESEPIIVVNITLWHQENSNLEIEIPFGLITNEIIDEELFVLLNDIDGNSQDVNFVTILHGSGDQTLCFYLNQNTTQI